MVLTYEKIREIQRKEQSSRQLQEIPENFVDDFKDYVKRKEKLGKDKEVGNARFVFKDIINRRERKIMSAALEYARSGVEVENLNKREKTLFKELAKVLKKYRKGTLKPKEKPAKKKKPEKEEKPGKAKEKGKKQMKKPAKTVKKDMMLVKVKEDLPDFVGPNLNIYSLRKKEIANLPRKIGNLLVKKGMAEELE